MFPETERSMSLRLRIVSGYFETALAREPFDQFRIGNTEKHLRPFRERALVFSLRHPETFGCDRRSLFEQNSNRLSPGPRSNLRHSVHHSQRRRRWIAVPKRLRDRGGFGVRSNPEHSVVFDISQVIRLAEGLILFPGFHRWNKQ